jgi:ketosteroid isomerase-like protein
MPSDADEFLARFRAFGAKPDPDGYVDLFDPRDGTVLHPGMRAPLHRDHVRAYMSAYLAAMPGFRFEVLRHAVAGDVIFVEARSHAEPGGQPLDWGICYCIQLRGERVLAGRAYADRVPLLARLTPDATLAEAAGVAALLPGLERPR